MALVDRITSPPPPAGAGMPCSIGGLYVKLGNDQTEIDALNRILYDLGWHAGQVYDALASEGHTVGRQSINRHRGKKCRCFKDTK